MATTVHVPDDLLEAVDRQARELGMSRNRYIVEALRRAVEDQSQWSPSFLDALREAREDRDAHRALDEMSKAIASRRTRKRSPKL